MEQKIPLVLIYLTLHILHVAPVYVALLDLAKQLLTKRQSKLALLIFIVVVSSWWEMSLNFWEKFQEKFIITGFIYSFGNEVKWGGGQISKNILLQETEIRMCNSVKLQ